MYRSAFQTAARHANSAFRRNMSGGNEKIPGNAGLEVGVGIALGVACALGVKSTLDKDVAAFSRKAQASPAVSAPKKDSPSDEAAMAKFNAWLDKQKAASPADPKDTADMKYYTFTELPPFTPKHRSLMAKFLTPDVWERYKDVKSSKGYSFSNAIQCGVMKPHLGVGLTAGDEECFELFKDIIYPIVKGWHQFDAYTQKHKSDLNPLHLNFSREQQLKFNEYVESTRIRAARNISGFALPAGANPTERKGVEEVLKQAFSSFTGELSGKYYPLGQMTPAEEDFLQSNGFLFQKPGPAQLLAVAGAARDWPDNRGIFHNNSRTALAWANEEDHCRIISMQSGGDVWTVFSRFCKISDTIKTAAERNGAKLMFSEQLGFLGTCPSNLGTGLRASVMIKIPELNKDPAALEKVCAAFDLQPRGSSGEHTAAVGGKWDISNKQRLGFSEVELVQKMIDGVTKIIAIEETLKANPGMTPMDALSKHR